MTDVCNGSGVCAAASNFTIAITGLLNKFLNSIPTGTITISTQMAVSGTFYNVDVLDIDMTTSLNSLQTYSPNVITASVV